MELWGRITSVSGHKVTLSVENLEELARLSLYTTEEQPEAVIQISDNRHISLVQRKKAYAIMSEMANFFGYDPSEMKQWMKYFFEAETGHEYLSLATTDMTTAREFITFLLDYAIRYHVPMKKSALEYQDDLNAYMYQSLKYRSCVICGQHADVHHVDVIGMGNDRKLVDHRNKRLIALCWEHHSLAHKMGWPTFKETYHLKGIILESELLIKLHIMTQKRMDELDGKRPVTTADERGNNGTTKNDHT
jgi:hypothetical protein